jgi:hypothetical protein
MSCWGVISRISTERTWTPQRTVSSWILTLSRSLISSRLDLQEDDEVDVDERVVLCDRGLLRLLDHELAEIDLGATVDERDQDHQPGAARPDVPPEPKDDGTFVLFHHADEEHPATSPRRVVPRSIGTLSAASMPPPAVRIMRCAASRGGRSRCPNRTARRRGCSTM